MLGPNAARPAAGHPAASGANPAVLVTLGPFSPRSARVSFRSFLFLLRLLTTYLVQRGNPAKPADAKKFYAQLASSGEVTTRQLMKEISARSTVSAADTMAVLESLLELLPEKLAQGLIVRLGDFGSFAASVTSEGVAEEEEFVASSMVTGYKIRFRAGKELTKAVAGIEYPKTAKAGNAAAARKKS